MKSSSKLSLAIVLSLSLLFSCSLLLWNANAQVSLQKVSLEDNKIRIQTQAGSPVIDVQLLENTDHCFTDCYAILKLHPYQDITLPQNADSEFAWNFAKEKSWMDGLLSYHFEILEEFEYMVEVPEYGSVKVNSTCYDQDNATYACESDQTVQTGSHQDMRYREEYKPFAFWGRTLAANTDYTIKLMSKKPISSQINNVDWAPMIKGLEINEWAWWNTSYPYRFKIKSNATIPGVFSMNDTYGVCGQIYWFLNDSSKYGQQYVYCNTSNCCQAVVFGNETEQTPWEKESDRTGFNQTQMYNSSNLVGYWHLSSFASDSTQRGNNWTLYGSPVYVDGILDDAINFSSPSLQYGEISDNAGLRISSHWSISAWFRFMNYSGCPPYESAIISKQCEDPCPTSWPSVAIAVQSVSCGAAGNYLFYELYDSSQKNVYMTYALTEGSWYHVALTCNGTAPTLYLNGEKVETSGSLPSCNPTYDANPWLIGRWRTSWPDYSNLKVDDVRVMNGTYWSDDEINEMYQNGVNSLTAFGNDEYGPQAPYFVGYNRSPDPPNEDQNVQVSVTIQDADDVDTVIIELDNGTKKNYTVTTKTGDEYYFIINSGNYTAHDSVSYAWYANDSFGNLNKSVEQSFTVANQVPQISILYPLNNSGVGLGANLPEFNWTATDLDNEDTLTYLFEVYYQNGTLYNQTTLPVNHTLTKLPAGFDQIYHWRVRANDSYDFSNWTENYTFQYANWTITFNATDSSTGYSIVENTMYISCNNSFSASGKNPYTATNMFAPGSWTCTFSDFTDYYPKDYSFTADKDKSVEIPMSPKTYLTQEEHDWLEWLYICWNNGSCKNLLEEINLTTNEITETVDEIWNQIQLTDQNVVTQENIINKIVNSTSNLTINYTIDVPLKKGYTFGETSGEARLDYLPIRISFWFLNESDNSTCYSQGNYSVAVAEPHCQPLTVYTIGQVNTTLSFVVSMRPSVPAGAYTIVRNIEIDPEHVWINYGREAIGQIEMVEGNKQAEISLVNTGSFHASPSKASDYAVQTASGTNDRITGNAVAGNPDSKLILALLISLFFAGTLGYIRIHSKRDINKAVK
jgi:hypothetical protein